MGDAQPGEAWGGKQSSCKHSMKNKQIFRENPLKNQNGAKISPLNF